MTTLVIDIETVGDIPRPEDVTDENGAAVVARITALREMAGAVDRDLAVFTALSAPLARVVCVGMRQLETGREACYYDADLVDVAGEPAIEPWMSRHRGEAKLLEAVNGVVGKVSALVTFNGRAFDIPVLVHRMVASGISPAPFLLRAARESRYPNWKGTPRLHVDLREQFTFFGAANGAGMSLRAFALGYGLPDPKAGGAGGEVAELVKAGDAARLCGYCMGDVRTTAALYERWSVACGVA